jgi:hypothetical protein
MKAATEHKHTEDKGQVYRCAFAAGEVFRSLAFPKAGAVARSYHAIAERVPVMSRCRLEVAVITCLAVLAATVPVSVAA